MAMRSLSRDENWTTFMKSVPIKLSLAVSLAHSPSQDLFLSPLARYTPGGKALSGPKPISLLLIRFFCEQRALSTL